MFAAAQMNSLFRLLIDDVHETRFSEAQVLLLMNRATHAVFAKLKAEGIYSNKIYEDVDFVVDTQEATLTLGKTYSKIYEIIKYQSAGDTADADLIDDVVYDILPEKLAKRSDKPCFYHRIEHTFAGISANYLGFYRVPSEAFSVRLYYAHEYTGSTYWTVIATDTWSFGWDANDVQDAIVYKMCELAAMSDTEQQSVYRNNYMEAMANIIKHDYQRTKPTEVVMVED